jgi:hypothetical protein
MNLIYRIYYAFMRWQYGVSYGCGRCHHAVLFHQKPEGGYQPCTVPGCPCKTYSCDRVNI